jgi:hypothetical protein
MEANTTELRYGLESFRKDWRHCTIGSDFLAGTHCSSAQNRQLASTAINEMLELAFRCGADASKSWVQTTIDRSVMMLSLDLTVKPSLVTEIKASLLDFQADASGYFEKYLGHDKPGILFGLSFLVHDLSASAQLDMPGDDLNVQICLPLLPLPEVEWDN